MAEYIEREALVLKVRRYLMPNVDVDGTVQVENAERYFLKLLEETPAADVVEVRHGEWLHTQEPLGWRDVDCIECSACKESWIMDEDLCLDDYNTHWRYCLNCGAKMDGKGEK